jgi:hypothetical protein
VNPGLLLPAPSSLVAQRRLLQAGHPINASLGGWWPLDDVGGLVARDISGYENHGALSGFTWAPTNGWVSTATGTVGGMRPPERGIAFNSSVSTTAMLSIPHGPQLDWLPEGTISLWAMPFGSGSGGSGRLFDKRPSGGTGFSAWWPNSTELYMSNNGSFFKAVNWSLNTWLPVVILYTSSTWKVYLGGALASSATGVTMGPNQSTPLNIGNRITVDRAAQCVVANVRCWQRILTDGEIEALAEYPWLGATSVEEMLFHQVLLPASGAPAVDAGVSINLLSALLFGASAETPVDGGAAPAVDLNHSASAETPVDGGAVPAVDLSHSASAETPVDGGAAPAVDFNHSASAETPVDGGASLATVVSFTASAEMPVDGGANATIRVLSVSASDADDAAAVGFEKLAVADAASALTDGDSFPRRVVVTATPSGLQIGPTYIRGTDVDVWVRGARNVNYDVEIEVTSRRGVVSSASATYVGTGR